LEWNGLPPDAKLWDTRPIPDRNPDAKKQLMKDVAKGRRRYDENSLMLIEELYWHPDGYLVYLRPDTTRSYAERRPKGSNDNRGAQKAHYNVYYEKDLGIKETDQHHTFDENDELQ
jgi:hypothetical protein